MTEIIYFNYYGVNVTHLSTIAFLHQKHYSEDGRITGRNQCW
jgi:hypothetical protein